MKKFFIIVMAVLIYLNIRLVLEVIGYEQRLTETKQSLEKTIKVLEKITVENRECSSNLENALRALGFCQARKSFSIEEVDN